MLQARNFEYFHACYPGDEIPKKFSFQSCGSSINKIKLPPCWNSNDLLGVACCVVLDRSKIDKFKLTIKFIAQKVADMTFM